MMNFLLHNISAIFPLHPDFARDNWPLISPWNGVNPPDWPQSDMCGKIRESIDRFIAKTISQWCQREVIVIFGGRTKAAPWDVNALIAALIPLTLSDTVRTKVLPLQTHRGKSMLLFSMSGRPRGILMKSRRLKANKARTRTKKGVANRLGIGLHLRNCTYTQEERDWE